MLMTNLVSGGRDLDIENSNVGVFKPCYLFHHMS